MVKYESTGDGRVEHWVYPTGSVLRRVESALREKRPDVVRDLARAPETKHAVHTFRHGFSVFLSYASEDKLAVNDLFKRLSANGYDPWLDEQKILPGKKWRREIMTAQQRANVGIVCCSSTSVNKVGVVQAEIAKFLELAELRPADDIYLIPVRLENCILPAELSQWQHVDLFTPQGYEKLSEALDYQALRVAERKKKPATGGEAHADAT